MIKQEELYLFFFVLGQKKLVTGTSTNKDTRPHMQTPSYPMLALTDELLLPIFFLETVEGLSLLVSLVIAGDRGIAALSKVPFSSLRGFEFDLEFRILRIWIKREVAWQTLPLELLVFYFSYFLLRPLKSESDIHGCNCNCNSFLVWRPPFRFACCDWTLNSSFHQISKELYSICPAFVS